MFSKVSVTADTDKPQQYRRLESLLAAIWRDERDFIANAANCAAVLFQSLADINWSGFYVLKGDDLVLGPFQGKPACVRIAVGRGVCGTAARRHATVLVPDVHEFPGHIACDAASNSEIVVPLLVGERVIGVLDIDSPSTGRFDEADQRGLEAIAAALIAASDIDF